MILDELTSARAALWLTYGAAEPDGLRQQVRMVGLRNVARSSGVPEQTLSHWCNGGNPGAALLAAVSRALAKLVAESPRSCARDGCGRLARPRSAVCSPACRKACARRASAAAGLTR